jgi:hypothetical protein
MCNKFLISANKSILRIFVVCFLQHPPEGNELKGTAIYTFICKSFYLIESIK